MNYLAKLEALVCFPKISTEHLIETTRLLRKIQIRGNLNLMEELSVDGMFQIYKLEITSGVTAKNKIKQIFESPEGIPEKYKIKANILLEKVESNIKLDSIDEMTIDSIYELWCMTKTKEDHGKEQE